MRAHLQVARKARGTITLHSTCPSCKKIRTVEVPTLGFLKWQSGALIQAAFPELDSNTREMLISGICPTCWDAIFKD